ncbi:MAG TPA: hypothetical protein VFA75_10060 [Nevskia sp.]|nr:hypothetical protein [Nevskia sp.]
MDPVHPFLRQRARLLRVTRFTPEAQGYDAPRLLQDRRRPFRLRQAMLLAAAAIALGAAAAQVVSAGPTASPAAQRRQPVIGSVRNAAIGFIALTAEQGGCPSGLQRAYVTAGGAAPAEASCWRRHGAQVLLLDRRGAELSYPAERFGLAPEPRP